MSDPRLHTRIGTFRQLEILLAVHEHGSITSASAALHLTQPTVSIQMKKLADQIGMPLYDQIGRRIVFTDAGLAVVESAREILDTIGSLDMKLADMRGTKAGKLRIGVVTTAKYFIPHLLGDFCQRYPAIDFDLKVGNREQIIDRVAAGREDFYVFSHPPEDDRLEQQEFLPNPLVAIAPVDHPLAGRKRIPLHEFASCPMLIREAGSGTRHAIDHHYQQYKIRPNVRMTIESNEAIKHAVMSGLGVSIISRHTLTFGERSGLAELSVATLPIMTNWYLVRHGAKRMSVVARAFLDYVNQTGRSRMLAVLAQG